MPTWKEVIDYIDMIERDGKPFSFDIETETEQITCLGLSNKDNEAMCIPFWHRWRSHFYTLEQEAYIWVRLKRLFEGSVPKIAQNGQFDILFLWDQMRIEVKNVYMDTMIAAHLCYPELPKALEFLTSIYTDQPFYKSMIHSEDDTDYFTYNALDACCTYEVAVEVEKELRDLGLWDFYTGFVNKLITPLVEMSKQGVKIDMPLKKRLVREYRQKIKEQKQLVSQRAWDSLPQEYKDKFYKEREEQAEKNIERLEKIKNITPTNSKRIQKYIHELVHPPEYTLNVDSAKQLPDYLYNILKLPKQYRRRKTNAGYAKTITADEEALEDLNKKFPRPIFKEILHLRYLQKLCGTYLEAKVDTDGRMRTSYLITGTETGRLASRTYLRNVGTNFQNIPDGDARRIFIPDYGKIFLSGDLSQAEACIVAYIAGEESLIRLYQEGRKIHKQVAAMVFGVRESDLTDEQYKIGKKLVHASNYGMGINTFAKSAGISAAEAKRHQNAYFAYYPGIRLRQLKVKSELAKSRRLVTPLGRKRLFLGSYNENMLRDGYAYQPQSTVSDILNMGLLKVWDRLPEDCEVMLQVHDSLVVQCYPEQLEECAKVLEDCLALSLDITDLNGVTRKCTMRVEFEVGNSWGDLEDWERGRMLSL